METIDLSKLSEEGLDAVLTQADAIKRQRKELKLRDELAMAQLEDELVTGAFVEAWPISNAIVAFKQKWLEKLLPLIEEKIKYDKAKANQESYTLKTLDAGKKIKVRNNKRNCYDDGIQAGIGYAKQWMSDQVDGEKSKRLISIIDDLLAKDKKGDYSPGNLLKFIKKAEEDGDELLLKASECIKKSIYEEMTSISLLFFEKDDKGIERSLPLSATKA